MRGLFLALEGIDASGKSSQLTLLGGYFGKRERTVTTLHFPRLDAEPYGPMVAAFLRGDYGSVDAVHPRLAALLYALDRLQAGPDLRNLLDRGAVVIADRYVYSNLAYQCAKVADPAERDRLAEWIETLEFAQHRIPRPDLTLFLDAPLSFSLGRLSGKRDGDDRAYLQGGTDIHEASATLQERVRAEFLRLAAKRPQELGVVSCSDQEGKMADKTVIHERIIEELARRELGA